MLTCATARTSRRSVTNRPRVPGTGQIAVTSAASNVNGVRVVTRNSTGDPVDRSFHLIVSC